MRIFEIILVLVNLLTIYLSFKKVSKVVRLWEVGINLFLILIHGILEGFRYQMIFSYIFVVGFVIFTLIKTKYKPFDAKMPKGLKVIISSVSIIFLIITLLLSYALPVFKLPKPTGSYDVGINYFHLVDENRKDPFLDKSTKKRELMIKVYYPAKNDDSKAFDRYFHNSSELLKAFAAGYHMPDFLFSHLKLVNTNSKEGLQISDKEQSYPVVLFSHGAGTTMEVQTSQCEDLASQGYIVAAIDHTYVSWAILFPDRVVTAQEATTNFNTADPAEIITQIMADDSKFVIDSLTKINEGKINSNFKGKLNVDKIGAIGHSVGGAVAYNLAINDKRIKAAVDLDGIVFVTPKDEAEDMVPFLMIANDKYHIQGIQNREPLIKKFEGMTEEEQKIMVSMYGSEESYKEAYTKASQNIIGLAKVLKSSGNLFTVEGSDHMKFTDMGFLIDVRQLRELMGIGGNTAPERCLEITKSVTTAFLNNHLKGKEKDALESQVNRYPELKKVNLN
ncbi:dienelactone hydrolase family protein [Clostridium swellfunianum]|uniref:alpha/beta hydrolase family protein n=1 Tax=Clostridium swellfunianum TaxID=1367462 RepID=UPI00202F25DB|nr:dienelactone hydrolase family protein [Clostridium swellfunianum]MCM0650205.1 dienelactone hydrolase family protein [Clostridium swellfunianum]